ncbi:hypothetical protein K469DRAFT_723961 [Zopfia rhizophila CBS 207.26]|uniref:RRM domain-containing protein n=1 Tax=Zopfia rhizophila CBS 207.26 TaxID=1314779 RepID=A0A6A6EGF8_9PEZI|nr:hypothetical protein K469DRAFT_723961 [Zopfia rhizophila CBS 207.26]
MSSTKSKSKLKSTKPPTTISDFTVLPLTLSPVASFPKPATHYVYVKPHTPSQTTETTGRSLFLANVPIDANEENIRNLFGEKLGGARVSSVEFDTAVPAVPLVKRWKDDGKIVKVGEGEGDEGKRGKKRKRDEDIVAEGVIEDEKSALPKTWDREIRRSGGCAVVVFVDRGSCKGAFKSIQKVVKEQRSIQWVGGEGLGVQRYKTHHSLSFPSKESLQSSINAYLTQFNRAELARNRLRAKQRSVPDEDGFITVVRGGRAGPARLEEAEQKKVELEERRKKKGAKEDFYRFQTRERRKEKESELKRKFEMDRRRVDEMRRVRGRVRPES